MENKVNGTDTDVHEVAMAEAEEQGDQPQVDPELSRKISADLMAYVEKLKETEDHHVVNMAVLNIQMENFRRKMIMSNAPGEIIADYQNNIMQMALDMIGTLVDVDSFGPERFISIRADIIKAGDDIAKAAMAGE